MKTTKHKMYNSASHLRGNRINQYISVIIASLGVTSTATYLSWPSPILPKLTSEDSPLGEPLTSDETSWIVSIFMLAGLPSALGYYFIADRFGRKRTLQVASVILLVPWFLIIFGKNVVYIYVARAIGGTFLGVTAMTVAMYNAEIADADIRGRLGTSHGLMKLVGSITVLSIGPFASYDVMAVVCGAFPLLYFFLLFFIPESPHFLIKYNRFDEARSAIAYLAGTDEKTLIDKKINSISLLVETVDKPLSLRQVLSNKIYLKNVTILLIMVNLELFCGSHSILAYQQFIIEDSESSISPEVSSIIFGLIQLPAGVMSAMMVDKFGRKVIMYIGCIGTMIPLVAEGVYFLMKDNMNANISNISWVPTTGIVIYQIAHAVVASIPYILLGELLTDKIKHVATSLFLITGVLSVFIVTKTFEPIVEAWGLYVAFWMYAVITLATIIFTYFFLPETKGKTFEEIELKIYQ